MEDVEWLDESKSNDVTGNSLASLMKENDGGEGEGTESSPEVTVDVMNSTMVMNSNITGENFEPLSTPTHNSTGDGNGTSTTLSRYMLNSLVMNDPPSSDSGECFLEICPGNLTSTLHVNASKEPRNTSPEYERIRTANDTSYTSVANISSTLNHSTNNTVTDPSTPQDQIAASYKFGNVTSSSSSPPLPPTVGTPLTPTTTPRPPSTTTPTPSFWVWLFG